MENKYLHNEQKQVLQFTDHFHTMPAGSSHSHPGCRPENDKKHDQTTERKSQHSVQLTTLLLMLSEFLSYAKN